MKVVVLTGPESAGKSTLSQALAERFNAPLVSEFVREFIQREQRETCYADISTIAEQQLQLELAARAQKPPLLLLDTHLLSNKIWSETLFNDSPAWLESALQAQHYDLIGLLSPDGMPWQADSQRCQPDLRERQAFHQQLDAWLHRHQQPVLHLAGTWQARYQTLEQAIEQLLCDPLESIACLPAQHSKDSTMTSIHAHDPLHGITLAVILNRLVAHYGWEELAELIPVNCFKTDPSEKSSLKFLRKTEWARAKVEALYISTFA